MEVIGKIKVLNAEQQVSSSFKKRELVVETSEEYPQFISINFIQDKCDLLNNYKVGQEVKVGINLRGREWVNPQGETRYFNDIQGWRVEKLTDANNIEVNNPQPIGVENESNPLPF
jgi:single-stranded DNA-binding protein